MLNTPSYISYTAGLGRGQLLYQKMSFLCGKLWLSLSLPMSVSVFVCLFIIKQVMILLVQHGIFSTLSISENKQLYCHLSPSCHIFLWTFLYIQINPEIVFVFLRYTEGFSPLQLQLWAMLSIFLIQTSVYMQPLAVKRRPPLNILNFKQTCTHQHILLHS